MQSLTVSLGILLGILGLASYFGTGKESITALIPLFFGIFFVIFGNLAKQEKLRKHMMHAAAGLALLGALGTVGSLPGVVDLISDSEVERPLAIYAQAAMFMMCLVYLIRAVKSFKDARKSEAE